MFAICSEESEAASVRRSSTASGGDSRRLALPPRALENREPMEGGEKLGEDEGRGCWRLETAQVGKGSARPGCAHLNGEG